MITKTATKTAKPTATARPVTSGEGSDDSEGGEAAQPALAKPLSSEDIVQVLKLGKGANSIELKLSVPLTGHRATIKSIGLDPVEAQPRQAFFFDTPDLALNRAGVVVRARRIQGGDADTVVKLRPVDPSTIDPELRRSAAFKVEVDVMPGGFVCSASFKGVCSGQEVLDVTSGAMPLRKLFSKEQRAFYDAHAPAGITMDKLVVLGPTFLLKAKHQPKDFDRPHHRRDVALSRWFAHPGGLHQVPAERGLPGRRRVQVLPRRPRHRARRRPVREDQDRAGVLQRQARGGGAVRLSDLARTREIGSGPPARRTPPDGPGLPSPMTGHLLLLGLCVALGAASPPTARAQPSIGPDAKESRAHSVDGHAHACVDLSDALARRRLQDEACKLPLVELPRPTAPRFDERPRWPAPSPASPAAEAGHAMFWRFPVQAHGPHEVPRHSWR